MDPPWGPQTTDEAGRFDVSHSTGFGAPAGRQMVHSLTRDMMVEMTRGGGGSKFFLENRRIAADVLEVSGDIAIARASSAEYLEYLSLAKCNGQWTIINILWRFQTPRAQPR